MRKIIVTAFMSLDGVFEAPGGDEKHFKYAGWTFPYCNEEFMKFKLEETMKSDALLLGRKTYQGFAKAWPSRKDDVGFADKFNSMPKYIVSKTLKKAEWNNSHTITKNVVEEIKKLKGTLIVHGSGTLARFLLENKLVDEVRILLYPVVLGTRKRLFADMNKVDLKLVESRPFYTGVVLFRYEPKKQQ